MKNQITNVGFFAIFLIISSTILLASCEQEEIKETENIDFQEIKESYTIYAPEGAFELEDLTKLQDPSDRQDFVDNINSTSEHKSDTEIELRYCSAWSSWHRSYPCEYVRWRYCGHSGYYSQAYQFVCVCNASPACTHY